MHCFNVELYTRCDVDLTVGSDVEDILLALLWKNKEA
jgi:hypothetical protein